MLHARARRHHWSGVGLASIKSFSGPALYRLERGTAAMDRGTYLLLNEGEHYTIEVDAPDPVESFCVFFPQGLAERIAWSLSSTAEAALDRPNGTLSSLWLMNLPTADDAVVSPRLTRLRRLYPSMGSDSLWLEEQYLDLLRAILSQHGETLTKMGRIGAQRASTRYEIFRRIRIAHDYIMSHYDEDLSVHDIASICALSPNRTIQHYREAFGVTPWQEIRRLRLAEAQRLLRVDGTRVSEIALKIGFQSPAAFSRAFRAELGSSPRGFRAQLGGFGKDGLRESR